MVVGKCDGREVWWLGSVMVRAVVVVEVLVEALVLWMPHGIRLHVKMQLEVTTMMRFISGMRNGYPPFAVHPCVHRPRKLKADAAIQPSGHAAT